MYTLMHPSRARSERAPSVLLVAGPRDSRASSVPHRVHPPSPSQLYAACDTVPPTQLPLHTQSVRARAREHKLRTPSLHALPAAPTYDDPTHNGAGAGCDAEHLLSVVRGWGASEWERSFGRGEGETRKRWLPAVTRDDGWTCVQSRVTDGVGVGSSAAARGGTI